MKTTTTLNLALLLGLLILASCNPKSVSMVSPNPPSLMELNYWIGSSKNLKGSTEAGVYAIEDCYIIRFQDDLPKGFGGEPEFNYSAIEELHFECDSIHNFDYEEGYLYKVAGYKHFLGDEFVGVSVDKVLEKVEDKDYIKVEELTVFIGPEKIESYNLQGSIEKCMGAQYGTYRSTNEWSALCYGIKGFDYEPGYLYKLKIRRTHQSRREVEMVMDNPITFHDELITLMRKQAM